MRLSLQLAIVGTIGIVNLVTIWSDIALAQRRPIADENLPENERTIVTPEDNIRGLPGDRIDGGARRGDNLFHSFQEFSIDEGRAAYFSGPGVVNILSRVTGNNVSEILGRLGVLGDANLFLLNPNGIIFGPNASLDIRGSFVASTADSFVFENGFAFSATNPQSPPLLTVSVPIGLQYGSNSPGTIAMNQSILEVDDGRSLILAGGEITLNDSFLYTGLLQGGRIELAGIAGPGVVGITTDGGNLRLSVPDAALRADISADQSLVDVSAGGGGDIVVTARNLNILENSEFRAGIRDGLGSATAQAGDIMLDATEQITIVDSKIINEVGSLSLADSGLPRLGAIGQGGSINIQANSLALRDFAELVTGTAGQGNAGDVVVRVNESVSIEDNSGMSSIVETETVGSGGDIQIQANTFSLTNLNSYLLVATNGQGDNGDISIHANDSVFISDSQILNDVNLTGVGQGGDIQIQAGTITVIGGDGLSASTFGRGSAGDVVLQADGSVVFRDSSIQTAVETFSSFDEEFRAVGNGGDIIIQAESLSMIGTDTTLAPDRYAAALRTNTGADGNAGQILIQTDDFVSLTDSSITTSVESTGIGRGGDIDIQAESILLDGSFINARTLGEGRSGDIRLGASELIHFSGVKPGGFTSELATSTGREAIGRAGDITVSAPTIRLLDGAVINARTLNSRNGGSIFIIANTFEATGGGQVVTTSLSSGRAGNINLDVENSIFLDGSDATYFDRTAALDPQEIASAGPESGLYGSTFEGSTGQGGTVQIDTEQLIVQDNAQIALNSQGTGNAGTLEVTAQSVLLQNQGRLTTETIASEGGSIVLNGLDSLLINSDSQIIASTRTGQAGNLTINANTLELTNGGNLLVEATGDNGTAGDLTINADELNLTRSSARVNSQQGRAGNVTITADTIRLEQGRLTAESASGQGGDITLSNSDLLLLRNGSLISTTAGTAQAGGDGGNITTDADLIVAFSNEDSDIRANAFRGEGGRVEITTQGIFGIEAQERPTDRSDITASSELGVQGTVTINTPDVDPSRGLTELPAEVVDVSQQIAQTCPTSGDVAGEIGEFVITGRGGLPPNPAEILSGETMLTPLAELEAGAGAQGSQEVEEQHPLTPLVNESAAASNSTITEAQGWVVGEEGQVMLVAETPIAEPHSPALTDLQCRGS